jgi:uncharacterized membrane protein YgcG
MTEANPRRARWSKGQLRVIAWLSAGLAFLLSGTAIAMAPKPPAGETAHKRPRPTPRKTIIQHRVIRRVVYDPPVSTGGNVTVYTAAPSGSGSTTTATSTSSGGSSGSSGSGTSSGGTTTTTGGS